MSVELLQMASLGAYIVAGVLLLVSIALFVLLDVPKLYGDISGRTAKKAIAEIRQQNKDSGNKAYQSSPVNAARGRLTDRITQSGKLAQPINDAPIGVGTEKFATAILAPETPQGAQAMHTASAGETAVLAPDPSYASESAQTTILTAQLNESDAGQTAVLIAPEAQAPVAMETPQGPQAQQPCFAVEVEFLFMESTELIE